MQKAVAYLKAGVEAMMIGVFERSTAVASLVENEVNDSIFDH